MAVRDVGVFRAHLTLEVEWLDTARAKQERLQALVRERAAGAALVLVDTTETAHAIHALLQPWVPTAVLHAGQGAQERQAVRRCFQASEVSVLVSTPLSQALSRLDVRRVIHHDWPGSLEGYHRQIMEAGLDGEPATAVLLSSPEDKVWRRRQRPAALTQVIDFARSPACRWKILLEHLGEELGFTRCGACDNCLRLEAQTEAAVREGSAPLFAPDGTAERHLRHPASPGHAHEEAPLKQGVAVAVQRHGWGWVQQVDDSLVTVDFLDGHSGRFTPEHVHRLSPVALDFAARLLPGEVSRLRQHLEDAGEPAMTYDQLLSMDRTVMPGRQSTGARLGPSDTSDSASDVAVWADGGAGSGYDEYGDPQEAVAGLQDSFTDASGTGERWGVDAIRGREGFDIQPDRIIDGPEEGFPDDDYARL